MYYIRNRPSTRWGAPRKRNCPVEKVVVISAFNLQRRFTFLHYSSKVRLYPIFPLSIPVRGWKRLTSRDLLMLLVSW